MAQEQLDIRVTDSGSKEVNRNIADIGTTAEGAARKVDVLGGALGTLRTLIAAAGIGFGITQLISYAEAYQKIIGQIRGVVSSNQALIATEQQLFNIAQQTRQSFEGTVSLFSNLSKATQGLNISQKEILNVTTLVNKTLTASGSSAEDASGAIKRLSLALARGTFDARAVTTIMLQFPALGRAVAQGLGVSIGQLTRMAEEGQITARDFFKGVENASAKIDARFKAMPVTIGQAFTLLQNEFLRFIGQINQANGITGVLSSGIVFLANNFATLVKIVSVATATWLAYRTGLIITATVSALLAASNSGLAISLLAVAASSGVGSAALVLLRGVILGLWAALAANPFTSIITILALVVAAVYAFGNSVTLTTNGSITVLGALVGVYNLVASAISQVISWVQQFVSWLLQLPGMVTFLTGAFQALLIVLVALTANQIIGFLASLAVMIGRVGAAMFTLLLNPLGLAVAAFVAAAVTVAYFTGTLDQLLAKVGQFGDKITSEMKKATSSLSGTGQAGTEMGSKLKAGTDLGSSGVDGMNKKLHETEKGMGGAKVANDFFVKSVVDGSGKVRFALGTVDNSLKSGIQLYEEMRREAVQASVDISNAYMETAQQVGDALELSARRGTQAYYDLQNAANGAASAVSAVGSASGGGGGGGGSGGGGSGSGGSKSGSKTDQYTTDYSPRWYGQPRNEVGSIGGGGLQSAIDGWLGKWGGRAVSQGSEYANVAAIARALGQDARDRLKDSGYSWIPGLRYGGSMMVPGSGGPDSQLAQLRVTPGERITVQTPEQQRKQRTPEQGGGNVFHISMTVVTPDADSFKRSKNQIQLELLSELGNVAGRL